MLCFSVSRYTLTWHDVVYIAAQTKSNGVRLLSRLYLGSEAGGIAPSCRSLGPMREGGRRRERPTAIGQRQLRLRSTRNFVS